MMYNPYNQKPSINHQMVYVIHVCKQGEVKCLQTLHMYGVPPIRATQVVKCKRGSWEGKKTHRFIQASNQYYGHQLSSKRKKNLEKWGSNFLSMLMCAFLLHPNFSCMRFPYIALFDLEGFCK